MRKTNKILFPLRLRSLSWKSNFAYSNYKQNRSSNRSRSWTVGPLGINERSASYNWSNDLPTSRPITTNYVSRWTVNLWDINMRKSNKGLHPRSVMWSIINSDQGTTSRWIDHDASQSWHAGLRVSSFRGHQQLDSQNWSNNDGSSTIWDWLWDLLWDYTFD